MPAEHMSIDDYKVLVGKTNANARKGNKRSNKMLIYVIFRLSQMDATNTHLALTTLLKKRAWATWLYLNITQKVEREATGPRGANSFPVGSVPSVGKSFMRRLALSSEIPARLECSVRGSARALRRVRLKGRSFSVFYLLKERVSLLNFARFAVLCLQQKVLPENYALLVAISSGAWAQIIMRGQAARKPLSANGAIRFICTKPRVLESIVRIGAMECTNR